MADLADIARELNVSSSLVSKVLNGRLGTTRVSAKTLRAIHARATNLNYQRNVSAAALASGKQNVIGVFIHRVGVAGSGIIDATIQGVSAEAAKHHLRLVINFFGSNDEFIAHCPTLHRGMMDGLILAGLGHKDLVAMLDDVKRRGVPVVTIHDEPLGPQFPNVGMDQVEIGKLATRHLIARGCRRIAHLCHTLPRFEGYRAALAEAGLPYDPDLVYETADYEFSSGRAALAAFRSRGVHFDGLYAQSDQQAVGFVNALVRQGGRIPQDVKVIGIDNSPYTDFTVVPLSSISQEDEDRGRRAVRMLLEQTAHRDEAPAPRDEWVPPVLYARESTETTEVA